MDKVILQITYPSFVGKNTSKGTTGELSFPYIIKPFFISSLLKYFVFHFNCSILFLPKKTNINKHLRETILTEFA